MPQFIYPFYYWLAFKYCSVWGYYAECCCKHPSVSFWWSCVHFVGCILIRWRRQWQPTPVLFPGKSHGRKVPGRLQSMRLWRVRHDWASSLSLLIFMYWRRKWQPTPVFLLGESQGWGSLVGCCLYIAQSQTRLKQLSSSSRILKEYHQES